MRYGDILFKITNVLYPSHLTHSIEMTPVEFLEMLYESWK